MSELRGLVFLILLIAICALAWWPIFLTVSWLTGFLQ